ncbi:MAG TPA: hypothetical protein ENI57_01020 [Ignavibacteria bacterium]|nr:hypothetical protein [Ignavibacteria bacterium]
MKFFRIEGQGINLGDKIFHEIVCNILVHREFTNAFPAKLIIEEDKVTTENSNIPHGSGLIDLTNFSPFPKNPNIAKFFKQIGWVEELGSGIRNIAKYCSFYSGGRNPEFIEGDIFKTIIPIEASTFTPTTLLKNTVKLNITVFNFVNDGVKKELVKVTKLIITQPGLRTVD